MKYFIKSWITKLTLNIGEYSTDIHSVDMNVIFRLDNNELIQIKWDNEFYCYGIGFEKLTDLNKRERIKTISLTENAKWKKLINKKNNRNKCSLG